MEPMPAPEGARMFPEYGLPEFHERELPTKRTAGSKETKKMKNTGQKFESTEK
jgi:hypothetical protein